MDLKKILNHFLMKHKSKISSEPTFLISLRLAETDDQKKKE